MTLVKRQAEEIGGCLPASSKSLPGWVPGHREFLGLTLLELTVNDQPSHGFSSRRLQGVLHPL